MPIETRRFQARDGVRLVGDVGGDPRAPTVVLMHGGGQTRHSWSGALRALVDAGYHVINYDARGHGESDWSRDGDYSMSLRARDLGDVLAGVGGPVALVGASMGGATSLFAIGEASAPRPAALVMVDIVPRPNIAGTDRIRAFMAANPEGFASLDEAADAVAAYNHHRPRPKDPSGLARNLRRRGDRWFWHWDPRMLDSVNIDVRGETMTRHAAGIDFPTLLVRGMASDIVDEAGVEAFRAALPDLEVFNVRGAGHMVAGDRNDVFNEGVLGFLGRVMPPR
ncbi:alpha/beta hydrolase [Sphingomonas sp. CL5.1]|nr:alpha/beta hydrolase [Sphingomonas sp. CL5.1]